MGANNLIRVSGMESLDTRDGKILKKESAFVSRLEDDLRDMSLAINRVMNEFVIVNQTK